MNKNIFVKSAFYGLRPIITGLIIYAAIRFAITNNVVGTMNWHTLSLLGIFALSLFALIKIKLHPIFVIAISAGLGIVLYY